MKRKSYIFLVFFGLLAALILVRKNQYVRSLAQTPVDVGTVKVMTEKVEGRGNIEKVNILFRTGKNQDEAEEISTIAFRILVKGEDMSSLQVVDNQGNEVNQIEESSELLSDAWRFPVNIVTKGDNGLTIDFAGVDVTKGGYSSADFEEIASFFIKSPSGYNINFDDEISAMYSKRRPTTNIWNSENIN